MGHSFDTIVLGSGAAGLTYALKMAERGRVAVITKRARLDGNTRWAQGGIAVVVDDKDSFDAHINDTIVAGDGLNDKKIVRICVEEGPARLKELLERGVQFTRNPDDGQLDLTREGGHSARRVVHAKDTTGLSIEDALTRAASAHPNITFFEHHHAIDLITRRRLGTRRATDEDRCLGAYVLDEKTRKIEVFLGRVVLLATGGAGKVYRYTTNPDVATGDGIAKAWPSMRRRMPPSPRHASVTRKFFADGWYRHVGWNWKNSMLATATPARHAIAIPSPVATSGFVG
jgi:L-aspartate oxidase